MHIDARNLLFPLLAAICILAADPRSGAAQESPSARVAAGKALIQSVCGMSPTHTNLDITANADGSFTLLKLGAAGGAKVTLTKDEAQGVIAQAAQEQIKCAKPYLQRLWVMLYPTHHADHSLSIYINDKDGQNHVQQCVNPQIDGNTLALVSLSDSQEYHESGCCRYHFSLSRETPTQLCVKAYCVPTIGDNCAFHVNLSYREYAH